MSHHTPLLIDTLNLNLPSGFEGRANAIARETVHYLGGLSVSQSAQLASLNLPSIKISGGEANGVIARRIALAIQRQVNLPTAGVARAATVGRPVNHAD
ncbi:MAG: hypothetical protein L3J89_11315 [Gammaproteobacteria bacterium]|nr:hypothetical protein [Gammaproteobacteria bacterium]